jgi:hypothetical protein
MDRETILKEMIRGADHELGDDVKGVLRNAMKAFSLNQLQKMIDAGVRFWPSVKGVPAEYADAGFAVPDLAAPADYVAPLRLLCVSPATLTKAGGATDATRHELAHAWDDVRNEKKSTNLRKLSGDALKKEVMRMLTEEQTEKQTEKQTKKQTFGSESTDKLPPDKKLSMQEMVSKYKDELRLDKRGFAHPTTAPKHVAATVMEFYAEGYSVFHGYNDLCQSRLMDLAPELYGYLEWESKAYHLATPNNLNPA